MEQPPVIAASKEKFKWLTIIVTTLLFLFIVVAFVSMRIGTIRTMRDTATFLTARHSESELQVRYPSPRLVYTNYADVPDKFRRGLHSTTNCEFHLYTKEGLPYWYFIVAIDRETRIVDYGVVTNY